MPRYDDDDYDRPRRDSGSKNTLLVLGIVGGAALLLVVGCVGFLGWFGFKAAKTVQEGMQSFVGMAAAEQFVNDLQGGRSTAAYANTTANFQSGMTQKQFDDFLGKNPILTKHQFHTMSNMNPVGQPPVKKVIVSFDLHVNAPPDEDDDDPDVPAKAKAKPTTKATAKKAEALKDGKCTVTMVEENGVWKVDALTVP
jgi:hypothetical protein